MAEHFEESSIRGVQNPRVVDLISPDTTSGEVVLTMVEDRPWGSCDEQLEQIQEKFNNYIDYVLDGHFHAQYPQYQNIPVRVRFECPNLRNENEPPARLIAAMRRFSASVKFGFEVVHSLVEAPRFLAIDKM